MEQTERQPCPTLKGMSERSEEVQQIMGRPPHWTLKWGLILIALLVAALGALSYYARYPETISVRVIPTIHDNDIPIMAEVDGRLFGAFCENGTHVEAGEAYAYMTDSDIHWPVEAPYSGTISYPDDRRMGDFFKAGELIFTITIPSPEELEQYFLFGFLDANSVSRVKAGMAVRLRKDDGNVIPVEAQVRSVAVAPNPKGLYYFEVETDDACRFPRELTAEIVVSNPRVIERLMPRIAAF